MASETPFATLKLKGSQCFGLDAHPSKRLHAAGLISGQLKLFSYEPPSEDPSGGNAQQVWSARPHTSACRAVRFAADGETIYSTGADGTLQERDIEKNKPVWRRRNAMPAPINAMALLGEKGVATGDDEGHVRCWDMRQRSVAMRFHEHTEYISDILYTDQRNKHTLAVSGGDGYLAIFDLRKGALWARSDQQEEELLCLCLMKHGKKLLCGTEEGPVGIYSWGNFGDVSDRLLGHPSSVDCMVPHTEDHMITGSADGLIRFVSVHPNKVLGILGDHGESPIEALAMDVSSKDVLISASHDQSIRLWDIAYLNEENDTEDEEEEGEEEEEDSDEDDDEKDSDDSEDGAASSKAPSSKRQRRGDGASTVASTNAAKRKQVMDIVKPGSAIRLGAGFFSGMDQSGFL